MTVKKVALSLMPEGANRFLRSAVHRRNSRLDPSRYRTELRRWYRLSTGRDCHLDNPRTLGEKIQWLKLYDSTPLKGRLADKHLVREWVAERVGDELLLPELGVWDRAEDIDFAALPKRYVLKATHGSGWNVIVQDSTRLDVEGARRRLAQWLEMRMAMTGGFELHYEFCEPRIVCQAYLEDDSGGLRDYKIMTFDGEPQFIVGVEGRFRTIGVGTYLPDWSPAPFHYASCGRHWVRIPRPKGLEQMLELSRELGRGFACARVDFHEVDGRVYIGEITFTDANGLTSFAPGRYGAEFGRRLELPPRSPFKGVML